MSTLEELKERVARLEEEMFEQGFWQRPVAPPLAYPETEALDCDWFQEPYGFVHLRFSWICGVCKVRCDGVERVSNATPKQFARNYKCEAGHPTKVLFKKD